MGCKKGEGRRGRSALTRAQLPGRPSAKGSTGTDGQQLLKIHPILGRTCMRKGHARQFRWWSVLRDVAAARGGHEGFTFDEVVCAFDKYGMAEHQVRQCFEAAADEDCVFYHLGGGRLWLNGLIPVCVSLDTVAGNPVLVDREDVTGRHVKFRAALYAVDVHDRTISRDRIQDEYGIAPNTQRRYERRMGVTVEHNIIKATVGYDADGMPDCDPLPIPYDPDEGHVWVNKVGDSVEVRWQAPNHYLLKWPRRRTARPGMITKVRRAIGSCANKGQGAERPERFLHRERPKKPPKAYAVAGGKYNVWHKTGDGGHVVTACTEYTLKRHEGYYAL